MVLALPATAGGGGVGEETGRVLGFGFWVLGEKLSEKRANDLPAEIGEV